jgi:hypothetical protein
MNDHYEKYTNLYEQKTNVHYSIEVSFKISTNKLQERFHSD